MKIIDAHTHIGNIFYGGYSLLDFAQTLRFRNIYLGKINTWLSYWIKRATDNRIPEGTKANLLASMKKYGITNSILLPIEPNVSTDLILSTCACNKELIPFCSVHPNDPKKFKKLQKYIQAGCKGLKIHPVIQDIFPTDVSMFELLEAVENYDIPVIFHSGYLSFKNKTYGLARNYIALFNRFRKINFILGHMNMFDPGEAISLAHRFSNVFLETSWQPVGIIKKAINKIGVERVIFGSDWPYSSQKTPYQIIEKVAGKNDMVLEKLTRSNIEKLIK